MVVSFFHVQPFYLIPTHAVCVALLYAPVDCGPLWWNIRDSRRVQGDNLVHAPMAMFGRNSPRWRYACSRSVTWGLVPHTAMAVFWPLLKIADILCQEMFPALLITTLFTEYPPALPLRPPRGHGGEARKS